MSQKILPKEIYIHKKNPTITLLFQKLLKEISESICIKTFLAKKIYKFDSLGKSPFERAKINK